jgi:hypothetical protein
MQTALKGLPLLAILLQRFINCSTGRFAGKTYKNSMVFKAMHAFELLLEKCKSGMRYRCGCRIQALENFGWFVLRLYCLRRPAVAKRHPLSLQSKSLWSAHTCLRPCSCTPTGYFQSGSKLPHSDGRLRALSEFWC